MLSIIPAKYATLTAVLIEAVKSLKSENTVLSSDDATLKNRLDRLEKLLGLTTP